MGQPTRVGRLRLPRCCTSLQDVGSAIPYEEAMSSQTAEQESFHEAAREKPVGGALTDVAVRPRAASRITATVDYDQEGLQCGHLRVPYSHDHSAYGHIPIPVSVAKMGQGPTVLLMGGVHGDEYEGPLALMHFVRDLPLDRLAGRIIAIPALNWPAYLAGTRTSPIDSLNLNRCFPGDRNGSPTEMIAHYVETVLLPLANYCFDFHAGGASLNYLPTLIVDASAPDAWGAELDKLILGFRPPRVLNMDMLGEDRVIAAAARRNSVRFVTGEFGGGASVNLVGLEILVSGLRGALAAIGTLQDIDFDSRPLDRPPIRTFAVKGSAHYVFAPKPGIFEPRFRLGEDVKAGQIAGYIHDPLAPWRAPDEIRFEGDGMVFCIRSGALVAAGDCLAHLASEEPSTRNQSTRSNWEPCR
jgi:predicted deacylase